MLDFIPPHFMDSLHQAIRIMSYFEMIAVVLAIAYLFLAIRENPWCWICGFSSTIIYLIIFWKVRLYSESMLQVFYLYMSGYGWMQWSKYSFDEKTGDALLKPISRWSGNRHFMVILITTLVALLVGLIMDIKTSASFPYLDAMTSFFAVVATYMVANKIFENWIYWMVIDSVSVYLFIHKGLYLTASLFFLYVLLCFVGFFSWRKHLLQQSSIQVLT